MAWLSAQQALAALGTKPQTLYANVSRGRIRARPDPKDPRRSLYSSDDVGRLAERQAGRRKTEAVAADTIRWGDPVLQSAVSTVADGRLFYRGRDAVKLAATATLEDVAALLWESGTLRIDGSPLAAPSMPAAFTALAARVTMDLPTLGRAPAALRADAINVLGTVASALAPGKEAPLHLRLARAWKKPNAAMFIREALVLLADHELNASTFAARVTVSTGAALSAAVLSGLSALTGPLHGGTWQGVRGLMGTAATLGPEAAALQYLAQGRPLPGFGHRLYPDGDARASRLLSAFEVAAAHRDMQEAATALTGELPNIDFAVAAIAATQKLPAEAPLIIFALARSVGWLAHGLEQATTGTLIRPRARYVGPPPEAA